MNVAFPSSDAGLCLLFLPHLWVIRRHPRFNQVFAEQSPVPRGRLPTRSVFRFLRRSNVLRTNGRGSQRRPTKPYRHLRLALLCANDKHLHLGSGDLGTQQLWPNDEEACFSRSNMNFPKLPKSRHSTCPRSHLWVGDPKLSEHQLLNTEICGDHGN